MGVVMTVLRSQHLGSAGEPGLDPGLVGLAQDAGARWGVDPALILGVIHQESGGNPDAVNPRDPSYGLMQVMVPTARAYDPTISATGLLDPWTNVDLGTRYLADQLARYRGDVAQALSAYNAGTATDRNQSYVTEVLSRVAAFADQLAGGSVATAAPPGASSYTVGGPITTVTEWFSQHPILAGLGALGVVLVLWRR